MQPAIKICIYDLDLKVINNLDLKVINSVGLVLDKNICLCWGFTAQSTQWGHVERGQFT